MVGFSLRRGFRISGIFCTNTVGEGYAVLCSAPIVLLGAADSRRLACVPDYLPGMNVDSENYPRIETASDGAE
jgi:hypothetical protein